MAHIIGVSFFDNRYHKSVTKSIVYDEILHLLELMQRTDLKNIVYHGSDRYLDAAQKPIDSPAAQNLVELVRHYSSAIRCT
ncbi:MAG: hypothetical protein ACIRZV_08925 [Limosilactobacillus mucosae]